MYYDFSTLEDIERYKFIGLVKIDSIFLLPEDTVGRRISHRTSFSIIELYRGDSISELKVSGSNHNLNIQRWTSCDMNLNPEEEWVLFAYQLADSTFQTGYCTFSKRYKSETGQRDWHYQRGFKEIEKIKELLGIESDTDETLNGQVIEKYLDGSIEVESEYRNGILHGKRTIWYQNGEMMTEEHFNGGLRNGKSSWYYEDGTIKRNYAYSNDYPIDSCRYFHQNGQIARRTFYSQDGEELYSASFSQEGQLTNDYQVDTMKNEYIRTKYFDSGELHYTTTNKIGEYQNGNTIQYYRNGNIEGTWMYFDDGEFKSEIKRWEEQGNLIFHQQEKWNGETIILKKADYKR